jgi:nitronate monooxygenase
MAMPELKIGDLIVRTPIIQGGMGVGVSLSGLASAVARAGGMGVIATAGIGAVLAGVFVNTPESNTEGLAAEIQRVKEAAPDGCVGVNIMVALADFDALLDTAIKEEADAAFMSAGLPMRRPPDSPLSNLASLGNIKTKLIPKVSSAKAVKLILRHWIKQYGRAPDAFVVEGPYAGGHLGFHKEDLDKEAFSLESLLTQTLKITGEYQSETGNHMPVIAGGGVYTGADVRRMLELGADGVMMATRFVTTDECDAHENYKMSYVNASEDDLMVIDSPLGLPGRAVRCPFLEKVSEGKRVPMKCSWKCITTCDYKTAPYCIARALVLSQRGNLDEGFAFAGANAYRATEIKPVGQVFDELTAEYDASA